MAGHDLVTAPSEPLTAAQLKAHSRVDFSDDDTVIDAYIAAARSIVEGLLKQALLYTVFRYRIDGGFPSEIRLPVGPLRTTTGLSIAYVDDTGTTQTLATTEYQVSLGVTGIIRPAYGKTWPSVRAQMDAVTVTYKAGEALAADLKPVFLQAVRMQAADLYENRGAVVIGAPAAEIASLSVRNLLLPFARND